MKAALFFAAFLILTGCSADLCENTLLKEARSLDGKIVASVFLRNCGATTPFITVVGLRQIADELDMDRDENWVLTAHDKSSIELSWKAEGQLEIEFSTNDVNATQKNVWENVRISYRER